MKVHNLTVCDQVRQEINGKFILIGVYTNGIILPQIPTTFSLGVWLLLESERLGDVQFKFRVRMPDQDVELFSIEGEVNVIELEDWTPIGFGTNILVGQPGRLTIDAMLQDETEWTTLRTLLIRQAPVTGVDEHGRPIKTA
ncbi:hypothetical protein CO665_28165 [Rhizobium anhuiense]|uniref:DUF6941 family protein n=1 Tax=Rhizobium anhuiense TaxID=1184720 RepID=UPI000BE7AB35|nr:hypothetical protein [Rhizobium anhuiense]PDS34834.1 hypothetical protein CO665_28165 [Rhizobium anhuiense]